MAGKSASLEKSLGTLGVAVVGVGVALGVESVRAAAKFQASMELIHTQAGRSQKTVEQFSKAVLAMSGSVATGPDELAKGLYHLASTGMSAAKTMQALKIAAEGAKIGHADLESVTNALNATLASGIKGAQNMSSAMGVLNATVGSGDMRMQDLADAMGTGVLTTAKNFGVSLKDVGAALAVFGDNNIRGADAAGKLQQSITYLEKPAKGADAVLKSIGLTSAQLRRDMGSGGLGKTLLDLHDHLKAAGDTGAKMAPILLDAFGRKPASALNTLLGQFGRFQQKQQDVQRGSKNFASDWTAYTQTFGYSWDRARAAFQSMTIEIGTKLLPTATKAMNWIGTTGVGDLEKFSGWVSRNKTPIEDIAKVLAAIAAFRFASSTLSKIPGMLGMSGRGGGGLLGGASKLAPVHVWVDNPNFPRNRPPVAGGSQTAINDAEHVAAGKVATSAAEKAAERTAAKWAATRAVAAGAASVVTTTAKLVDPLYYTYLATQGGSQAPGQKNAILGGGNAGQQLSDLIRSIVVRPGFDLAKAGGAEKSAYAAAFHGGGGQTGVNTAAAVSFIQQYGSPAQIASLQKLAGAITGVGKSSQASSAVAKAAANREADAWGGAARAMAASQQRADSKILDSVRNIPGAMRQVAAQAQAAGLSIGEMLDQGITVGIRQGQGNIAIVSTSVIDGVRHTMMTRARASSPSKMTMEIGGFLAAGLALGMRAGKKGVSQAASELMDTVKGSIMGAGGLGNVASMSDTLGATGGTSIQDILAFTGHQRSQDKTLARNLALARKHGLSRANALQIAQLDPNQGAPLAASLAHATRAQLRRVDRDEAAIGRSGQQIGGLVNLSDSTIAKQARANAHAFAHAHITVSISAVDRKQGVRVMVH